MSYIFFCPPSIDILFLDWGCSCMVCWIDLPSICSNPCPWCQDWVRVLSTERHVPASQVASFLCPPLDVPLLGRMSTLCCCLISRPMVFHETEVWTTITNSCLLLDSHSILLRINCFGVSLCFRHQDDQIVVQETGVFSSQVSREFLSRSHSSLSWLPMDLWEDSDLHQH